MAADSSIAEAEAGNTPPSPFPSTGFCMLAQHVGTVFDSACHEQGGGHPRPLTREYHFAAELEDELCDTYTRPGQEN